MAFKWHKRVPKTLLSGITTAKLVLLGNITAENSSSGFHPLGGIVIPLQDICFTLQHCENPTRYFTLFLGRMHNLTYFVRGTLKK